MKTTRHTKADRMADLIAELNHLRVLHGKPEVERAWTGAGHWLKTKEQNYKSIGGVFVRDDEFIGFLEGLIFQMED